MTNLGQTLVVVAIGLIVFVNLLNPGGWIIASILILCIVVFYGLVEFIPEYLLVTNQGKNARKDKRRQRRASGLNPFNRTSERNGGRTRDTQTNTEGSSDE